MAKKSSRWEREGDKGGKGKKKLGEKTEFKEKKGRNGKGKKRKPWRIEPSSHIDLAQESNALPVAKGLYTKEEGMQLGYYK